MTKKIKAKKQEKAGPPLRACEVMTATGWEYFEGPDMSIDFPISAPGTLVVADASGPKGVRILRRGYAAGHWSEARSVPVRVPETAPSEPAG